MATIPPPSVASRSIAPAVAHAEVRRTEVASVSDEAVAKLAYEKHVARGYEHGFDQQDWAQAKRELSAPAASKL